MVRVTLRGKLTASKSPEHMVMGNVTRAGLRCADQVPAERGRALFVLARPAQAPPLQLLDRVRSEALGHQDVARPAVNYSPGDRERPGLVLLRFQRNAYVRPNTQLLLKEISGRV